jgi:DNA-directed RNA polymerase specialized sigma24 family protein
MAFRGEMTMSGAGSVTNWITELKAGNPDAAQKLWERYYQRLIGLARKQLQGARLRGADESDVVLSAFDSFFRSAGQGRFSKLTDRHDLWSLLVVITVRKAIDLVKREQQLKNGGGALCGESALLLGLEEGVEKGMEQVVSKEPTPEFATQVAEECQRLLDKLSDEQLRSIAVWKMEGYTNDEIGKKLDLALATVERRLHLIRSLWREANSR